MAKAPVVHPLDPADAPIAAQMRVFAAPAKGASRGIEARPQYDAFMESVFAAADVTFEADGGRDPGTLDTS